MVEDFRDVLVELLKADARFLIVGAHALGVHGVPRATVDLDVWIDPSPANARRVWQALASFGAPLESLMIHEADFARPDVVAQFGLPPYRIDSLTSVSGISFPAERTSWAFLPPLTHILDSRRALGVSRRRQSVRVHGGRNSTISSSPTCSSSLRMTRGA